MWGQLKDTRTSTNHEENEHKESYTCYNQIADKGKKKILKAAKEKKDSENLQEKKDTSVVNFLSETTPAMANVRTYLNCSNKNKSA